MQPDGPILGFDTSGPWCAVGGLSAPAIAEGMERGQAERLFPLIEAYLACAGTAWDRLRAIGVGIGPGNFTGVRIGVAAARGLALSLGIPAVGVSTFDLMLGETPPRGAILISLPALHGAANVQTYRDGWPIGPPALLTPGEARPELREAGLAVLGFEAERIAAALGAATARPVPPPDPVQIGDRIA
ncbi:MAG: tRNA (adenosine(37)-N6)-threonylcarbamoyltransferase complex dimerization subunit type 1 TsaB, partial [Gemmobacter sp.]